MLHKWNAHDGTIDRRGKKKKNGEKYGRRMETMAIIHDRAITGDD